LAGGNVYAVDATTSQTPWSQQLVGAIGGGVITYYH
jgi:outer membrane protein assembly factor BamB